MDDADIVALYWSRSEQAIAETAAKYGSYCGEIALRILQKREDAEECVNDTWLGAWNAMPPHRPSVLSTFLGKITRRLALGLLRREGRLKRGGGRAAVIYEELSDCLQDHRAASAMSAVETRDLICRFLDCLAPAERNVFLARYWAFASIEEICTGTGFSPSKVKTMLYRSRLRLAEYLETES